jgi:ubiquinone/menaquinone biosynthesis C-methylase UbiE
MDKNTKNVKDFYENSTDTYYRITKGYIHGYGTPDGFMAEYLCEKIIKPNSKVLDTGCGMGRLAIEIAQQSTNTEVVGITISPVQVKIANQLIQEAHLTDRIKIFEADFNNLSLLFEKNYFDVIIFNESLFHSNRPQHIIKQVYQILKPQGFFYAKDIYKNQPSINLLKNLKMQYVVNKIKENYHYHPQNPSKIKKNCIKSGFEIVFFDAPPYPSDFKKTIEFEKNYGYKTFELISKINATHWRELICKKISKV